MRKSSIKMSLMHKVLVPMILTGPMVLELLFCVLLPALANKNLTGHIDVLRNDVDASLP